jgi:hypothetical protein
MRLAELYWQRFSKFAALTGETALGLSDLQFTGAYRVSYTQPSRYNWMLQYYLRAEGLALSWAGTGRLIFSLNYNEADFQAVIDRFVAAAVAMHRDGWWWSDPALTNKSIKRSILKEMIWQRFLALPAVYTQWCTRPFDFPDISYVVPPGLGRSIHRASGTSAPCNTGSGHGTGRSGSW